MPFNFYPMGVHLPGQSGLIKYSEQMTSMLQNPNALPPEETLFQEKQLLMPKLLSETYEKIRDMRLKYREERKKFFGLTA